MRPELRAGTYSFIFAGDGAEALEQLLAHGDVQLVISDINMPRMDGLTLPERIQTASAVAKADIAYGRWGSMGPPPSGDGNARKTFRHEIRFTLQWCLGTRSQGNGVPSRQPFDKAC